MRLGAESYIRRLLADATIQVGGDSPHDVRVHDRRFFRRVLLEGSLGLGESYVDGWWDADDLVEFFARLIRWRNVQARGVVVEAHRLILNLKRALFDLQSRRRANEVVAAHYDLPTVLFEQMLGRTMCYSCGYWGEARSLDEAQENKLDLVCRKLRIGPSDRVLDLGCGFGSFARFAAEKRGCSVVGVSLSRAQVEYARHLCQGLPVEVHCCDYRDVDAYARSGKFDRVVSIAMFEAVGHKSYRAYMEIVRRSLKDGGLWLLHTIGDETCSCDPWLNRYIFPNGELPTRVQIQDAVRGLFEVKDVHAFGMDYWRTLTAWLENFRSRWSTIGAAARPRLGESFFRMWTYYLSCCAGAFRSRNLDLWQIVLSDRAGEYSSAR
jgi:cyclopropane-fatty-acyl-phospholipid synthase